MEINTDRGFNSYESMAKLKVEREVDSVMRLHQRRKVDFRRGNRLGDHDCIQTWLRPPSSIWSSIRSPPGHRDDTHESK